ncbi:phenylalanine--tRNA ligase subunit beta [Lentilactobacillus sp. Marseille-Q4993]|uniref:phenylalanine--tRNA ligase subunit beta n=1 Tax=Lentilactobacillus sp. Marseille-Q4993 TaxID=3039492 RepID=UPI0024BCC854|nr:phenylalanine--tRNA ligase subunit beta [Lentilactobacillus sp. Marseille-Q4993]
MKLSYKWVKEYLDLNIPAKDLAEKIERTAVEVDSVVTPSDSLKKIVVGKVLSMENHPDSDHLHVCQVDVGEEEPLQIVCGAPNVAEDQKVIVALPGSRIGGNVKIKRSKMRGVVSNGMICGLDEIGISKDLVPKEWADGIYVFEDDAKIGDDVYSYLGLDDPVIDLDVTPNRGDMLSVMGSLHELAAIYDKPLTIEQPKVEEAGSAIENDIQAEADPTLAPVYKLRVVKGVTVKPSPAWLQVRLWTSGIRPINNIVDVTNYILLKYGQPLHAFDRGKINGNIKVRTATEGETIVTLDEEERELKDTDIVIADNDKPIAIAGVMGGLNSEIDDDTTDVAIESAIFDSIKIRKTARRLVLHSEASQRFERGINYDTVQDAVDEAAALMVELGGGTVDKGTVSASDTERELPVVNTSSSRINKVLGTNLTSDEIQAIFNRLGFDSKQSGDEFVVTIPARRWDISIPADLNEEIARIYGYDNLPATLPTGRTAVGALTARQKRERALRHSLEGLGLTQAISYSLTTAEKAKMYMTRDSFETKLSFPMTQDHAALRMNLMSGLVDDVAYNKAHKVSDVALYEFGRVFFKDDADQVRPSEVAHVAAVLTGNFTDRNWDQKAKPVDFYLVKGIVDHLISNLGILGQVTYVANSDIKEMHPGRTADILIGGKKVGFVGQVHPKIQKQFKINDTYGFELDFDLLDHLPQVESQYQSISKYPAVTRDIAVEVNDEVTNTAIEDIISKRGGAYLKSIELFDVYNGDNIADGRKSMAYSLTFNNPNDTLKDEEVNETFEKIKKHLTDELSAEIR